MASPSNTQKTLPTVRSLMGSLGRLLGSLKLAVLLTVVLAVVLAGATLMEASRGREYALWYAYHSSWFIALLALLAVNILAATLGRFPWKRRQIGFVVTHLGLLLLLVGSLETFVAGIDGSLSFAEGEAADSILITDRSQIGVFQHGQHGEHGQPSGQSTRFSFYAGPVDWPAGRTLDFGVSHGVGIKLLKFYSHARREVAWVADESGHGRPALKLALTGQQGAPVRKEWLPTDQFRRELWLGPAEIELRQASVASLLEDFLKSPADEAAKEGVLSMHYEGQAVRIPVGENIGKKVPIGDGRVQVEIVEYLANAKPGPKVQFTSHGDDPKNPLLELRIHLPDEEKPLRQLAFAKDPYLNLDGVHGRSCPVKFWYHHPAVSAEPGAEFLQTPDGKLYCRVAVKGSYQSRGEVHQGDTIEMTAGFNVSILEYLPRARSEVTYQPVELAPNENGGPEAAALVEVAAAGKTQQVWLKRADEQYGFRRVLTPEGPLLLSSGYEHVPLDFSLKLLDFRRGKNPGGKIDASFASSVQLVDEAEGIDEQREISMNRPMEHGKFTFYQSSFQELPDGRQASVLSVACDPGRFLKYLGCLMLCAGTFTIFYLKGRLFRKVPSSASQNRTDDENNPPSGSGQRRSADPPLSSVTGRQTGTGCARIG